MSASFRVLPIKNSQILLAVYESPHIIGEISLNAGTLAVRFVRKELLNFLFHRLRHWSVINSAIWSLVYSRVVSLFINRLYLFKLDSSELAARFNNRFQVSIPYEIIILPDFDSELGSYAFAVNVNRWYASQCFTRFNRGTRTMFFS